MSMELKKSMGWTVLLIVLGVAAIYGGVKWLLWIVPAAVLVWHGAKPRFRGDRN